VKRDRYGLDQPSFPLKKIAAAMISRPIISTVLIASFYTALGISATTAEGLTTPVKLPAFDSMAAACKPPAGVDRSLVFLQDNDRQFMEGVKFGLAQAAERRGLKFTVELAEDDSSKMISAVDAAVAKNMGALVAAPIDALGLAPSLRSAIAKGTYVCTVSNRRAPGSGGVRLHRGKAGWTGQRRPFDP
jgi:ribose transport system substrate-binding protein